MAIVIPVDEVVSIPAKQAVVADKLWVTQLVILTPTPGGPTQAILEYRPWAGEGTDPIGQDADGNDVAKRVVLNNVFEVAAKVPQIGFAMQAILNAVPAFIKEARAAGREGL